MDCLLFTTSDVKGGRATQLTGLLSRLANDDHPPRHYLLIQNSDPSAFEAIANHASARTVLMNCDGRVPLSRARNIMLERAATDGAFVSPCVVGFPDDDAGYTHGFLTWLKDLFTRHSELDVLLCQCSPTPQLATGHAIEDARFSQLVRQTTSNTMFFRSAIVGNAGLFDESLGLGTPAFGGEDTEYMLRAAAYARQCGYISAPLIQHSMPTRGAARKYYPGSLAAIARHSPYNARCAAECVRKAGVGLLHVASGQMTINSLSQSYLRAFEGFVRSARQGARDAQRRNLQQSLKGQSDRLGD